MKTENSVKNWQLTALLGIPVSIVWGVYKGESIQETAIRTFVVCVIAGGARFILDRIKSRRAK